MTIQTATLQELAAEKKSSIESLKISVGEHHFNGPVAGPKGFDKNWDKGWNKDGH